MWRVFWYFIILLAFVSAKPALAGDKRLESYQLIGMINHSYPNDQSQGVAVIRHRLSQQTFILRIGQILPGSQNLYIHAMNSDGVWFTDEEQLSESELVLGHEGGRSVEPSSNVAEYGDDSRNGYQQAYLIDAYEIQAQTDEYFLEQQGWQQNQEIPPAVTERRAVVTIQEDAVSLNQNKREPGSKNANSQTESYRQDWSCQDEVCWDEAEIAADERYESDDEALDYPDGYEPHH
ncbi:MAG: hypothetical protein ACOH5I_21720 [Oligoflexus sp.]